MISEKGMVGQRGRELQVISPWVGPTVAQVRTGNIRLVLGCVWRKTLDGGRGVCSGRQRTVLAQECQFSYCSFL